MDQFLVGSRKGLFRFDRAGSGWQQRANPDFLAEPVSAFLKDDRDGAIYVSLNHGHFGTKLHRSDDDGANWVELPTPSYPKSDAADAPNLQMIWTIAAGGVDQPGRLWAGTMPGGLFRTDDRGETWMLNQSLWEAPEREKWFGGGFDWPGIHSILVDPRDSRKLIIGVSCGGVWRSEDDGDSWSLEGHGLRAEYMPPEMADVRETQDPHLLATSPADPDRIWCQHHNGIFHSRDGGRNFEELQGVEPASFGFAVAVHPSKPDTAWFVPGVKDECRVPVDGKLVVTRTEDGGDTLEILDGGLPHGLSYDLIYRHSLACNDTGNQLIMGSTTGNLWISEDGGDEWRQISANLPPIAQVAFV